MTHKPGMAPSSKVIALPGVELAGLSVAATSFPGNQIRGSRNEIWLCAAYAADGQALRLYVKLGLDTRAMMAEALCSLLAHCLGLSTPRPYLVTVRPSHVGRSGQQPVLAFGSQDVAQHSTAKPLRDLERLLQLLQARKVADLACVFDEWVANPVRSPSDILVSPESHVYLIDHEAALPAGQRPDQPATNWLAGRLLEGLSIKERVALLRQLRGRLAALQRVDLGDAPGASQYSPEGVHTWRLLLQFLRDRLQHLDRLISERIIPEQAYLQPAADTPPASHDSGRTADV